MSSYGRGQDAGCSAAEDDTRPQHQSAWIYGFIDEFYAEKHRQKHVCPECGHRAYNRPLPTEFGTP